MARNIEIKARVRDPGTMRQRIEALAGTAVKHLNQVDTFYQTVKNRLKLRVINGQQAQLIAYQRPNQTQPGASQYTLVGVADHEAMHQALTMTLGCSGTVRKTRVLFLKGRTRIHLDSVEDLGWFLELEVVLAADQADASGQQEAQELINALGVAERDLIACAYIDLLRRQTQ